jgi:hypothetical protein
MLCGIDSQPTSPTIPGAALAPGRSTTSNDIATYLKTGHSRTSIATGLMAETISQSTSQMIDADLRAIAVYLKDRQGRDTNENQSPVASDQPSEAGT